MLQAIGKTLPRNQRGLALVTVLVALMMVTALIAGALFVGTQEQRTGESVRRYVKAFGVSEQGAFEVLNDWSPGANNGMALYPGSSVAVGTTSTSAGSGAFAGSIYKLTSSMYLVDVTGSDSSSLRGTGAGDDGSRQRVGLLTRIVPLNVDVQAAFTVLGPVNFGGGNNSEQGSDHIPPGWSGSCGPARPAIAGVRAKSAGDLASSQGQFSGNPASIITPSLDSTAFNNFGTQTYAQLAAVANITLANGASLAPAPTPAGGPGCTNMSTNWGDGSSPTAPCGNRFPIVHATGSLTLTGGQGQGMLLVDGDLTITGQFNYYGFLIVKGGYLKTTGLGSFTVYGAVLVNNVNLSTTAWSNGIANSWYSNCALLRTKDAIGTPAVLRSRGWTMMM